MTERRSMKRGMGVRAVWLLVLVALLLSPCCAVTALAAEGEETAPEDVFVPESYEQMAATIPKDHFNGEWDHDLLLTAESQGGYTVKQGGYTRFGGWYGDPYGAWCAMFVAFCLRFADIPEEAFPTDRNCSTWVEKLKESGQFREPDEYDPKPGDLIFMDWGETGKADHMGIICQVFEENDKTYARCIEGNIKDAVHHLNHDLSDTHIVGYGELPEEPKTRELPAFCFTDATMNWWMNPAAMSGTFVGPLPYKGAAFVYPVEAEVKGASVLAAYSLSYVTRRGAACQPEEGETFQVTLSVESLRDLGEKADGATVVKLTENGPVCVQGGLNQDGVLTIIADECAVYAVIYAPPTAAQRASAGANG